MTPRRFAVITKGKKQNSERRFISYAIAIVASALGTALIATAVGEPNGAAAAQPGGDARGAPTEERRDENEATSLPTAVKRRLPNEAPSDDEIAALVAARGRSLEESAQHSARLEAAGWQEVKDVVRADGRLVALDPALIDEGREDELRTQIASGSAAPRDVENLAAIARRAKRAETRRAAVEALGYVKSPAAQDALIALLMSGDLDRSDIAHRAIAPLLRPASLTDDRAASLVKLLDSGAISNGDKEQIAFTLAMVSFRDGTALPDALTRNLSRDAIDLLAKMKERASRGPVHIHNGHENHNN